VVMAEHGAVAGRACIGFWERAWASWESETGWRWQQLGTRRRRAMGGGKAGGGAARRRGVVFPSWERSMAAMQCNAMGGAALSDTLYSGDRRAQCDVGADDARCSFASNSSTPPPRLVLPGPVALP
jgi:hypothetical protein